MRQARHIFAALALIAGSFWLTPGTAQAQEQLRQPQQVPRVPANRIQDREEDVPTLTRRVLEMLGEDEDEAEEEQQRRADRGREPVSDYGLECRNIRRLQVMDILVRVHCQDPDRYGNLIYTFPIGGYGDVTPDTQIRRWHASELIQAVQSVTANPNAVLHMRVSERYAYEPRIQYFYIEYED
ncbi:hypothetical protein V0U79_05410 [Hyphobacterium sp. HN65]|uniref:Uncharacterized protein n=1 Tax=Hyphobacterium lacteum TaxID=3116575 RepID=A0ABU7LQ94_9PROT|nr:hypothetical protein [Hyphobacterium sp. HN65]MEE2525796.1 hypothetical protein [Hyphobacterium sp. HN65]